MTADVPATTVTEVKRRLDGSEQRFTCELVSRTPRLLVALYRFEDARGPVDSYGLFWPRRPYLCYAMQPQRGGPAVFRFDVLRDTRVASTRSGAVEVSYTDLLLDLWVEAGVPRWEDEDELRAAIDAGRLTPSEIAHIARARATLEAGYARIIAEVRREVRGVGRAT